MVDPLAAFSEPTRVWFQSTFVEATPPQAEGWPAIAAGDHTLICAPTGTGKTLAAFLWAIDRLMTGGKSRDGGWTGGSGASKSPGPPALPASPLGTRVLYVSPLRALAVDVQKNLRAPLAGIGFAAERLGASVHEPTVGVRTGDTSTDERRKLIRRPPNILITTPESLFLMLTSRARETLATVEHVIIDEIHAVAATKRGTHLMVSLERLEELTARSPQRIALSATQRPLSEIARFLGGFVAGGDGVAVPRPVTVIKPAARKELDVQVVVPVADMSSLGEMVEAPASAGAAAAPLRRSIWPAIHPRLLELVLSHQSTLIFSNARRLSERLAARLNEMYADAQVAATDEDAVETRTDSVSGPITSADAATSDAAAGVASSEGRGPSRIDPVAALVAAGDEQVGTGSTDGFELVKAHHGSLSRQRRLLIEDELKRGELRGLVATSTLELGIDMGAVDLVVQVASPTSVASAMQRIGRAGHRVGEPSRGRIFPKHRADLLEAAAVVERMHLGEVERTHYPRNAIDVAAQQIVAMCAMDEWPLESMAALLRRSAPFAELSDEVLTSILELLSGTYPAEEFSELRPRVVWDRASGVISGRAGAQRLAATNAGTIPDRGLFGVFLPDGTRVGELDEEMVYESRVGEVFLLGATTWRIVDITFERVVVTPAPGELGKMPFWHGDGPGRPVELGAAIGELVRELRSDATRAEERLKWRCGLDETAASNLAAFIEDQAEATGVVPDDRTIVVERFRDEIGDWRVCVLSPFGAQVHAPWGMALQTRLAEAWGVDVDVMWADDGIVMRLPEAVDEIAIDDLLFDPDEVADVVVTRLPETAMFASRFRECAARALLLPRRRPGQRTPLWQQRRRAADLLSTAAKFPSFPILLEATRECVNDVFDLPALVELMTNLRSRRVRLVAVDTPQASPFAQSLMFSWISMFMYEGDAPLAERRAAALALDRDLLRDLLGAEELRELLDSGVIADIELELQRLTGRRRARDADEAHDLLRVLGPLTVDELAARSVSDAGNGESAAIEQVNAWLRQLEGQRRAMFVRVAGRKVVADVADAARLRDAAGVALPVGLPASATDAVEDPLGDLCLRFARSHGPFVARDIARWLGVSEQRSGRSLASLVAHGRLLRGEFHPNGFEREFCDPEVLRRIRRRCLAVLRHEVEPVPAEALARFLPAWQGVGSRRRGVDALADIVAQLQGAPIVASVLETDVLSARMAAFKPADLDELCTSGEVVWVGAGPLGATDGRVRLVFRDQAPMLLRESADAVEGPVHDALRQRLRDGGASFWPQLVAAAQAASLPYDTETVLAALWDLVWAGEVTNDSLAPLRARVSARHRRGSKHRVATRRSVARRRRLRLGGLSAAGPPSAAGRWSLVESLRQPVPAATAAALARAHQLLDRYGVVTRESALGEGQQGGFAGVYPVLKALEERGEVRRGYFVAGLGAAQFALPGAVDRLRSTRDTPEDEPAVVLAATDPAQPYGAALSWPASDGRASRSAGAYVVLSGGALLVELERGARSLVTFAGSESNDSWIDALMSLVKDGRLPKLEIAKVNGTPIREMSFAGRLEAAGFTHSYRGMLYRA